MKKHREVQYYSESDQNENLQSVSFIRYDVHGKPTYFEIPNSMAIINEKDEKKNTDESLR